MEAFAELVTGQQVDRVAFEAGSELTGVAQGRTCAADHVAGVRTQRIARARADDRAVRLEHEDAAIAVRAKEAAIGDVVVGHAAQRSRIDDAVGTIGLTAGRFDRVVLATAAESAGQFVAVAEVERVGIRIFGSDRDVTATVGEVGAPHTGDELRRAIAALRDAGLAAQRQTVVVALEDEVDDTGNRVRTVNRGVTAGHDVDTLEQVGRDGVHVDQVIAGQGRDVATTVDENQRTAGAEAAKVEQVEACGTDEAGRVALAEGGTQRRKVVQRVTERDVALIGQFAGGDRGQRHGRGNAGARNARTGNDDHAFRRNGGTGIDGLGRVAHAIVVGIDAIGFIRGGVLREGRCAESKSRNAGGRKKRPATTCDGGVTGFHLIFPPRKSRLRPGEMSCANFQKQVAPFL